MVRGVSGSGGAGPIKGMPPVGGNKIAEMVMGMKKVLPARMYLIPGNTKDGETLVRGNTLIHGQPGVERPKGTLYFEHATEIKNPVELIPVTEGLIKQFEGEEWAKEMIRIQSEEKRGDNELALMHIDMKFAMQLVERLNKELAPQGLRVRIPTEAVIEVLQRADFSKIPEAREIANLYYYAKGARYNYLTSSRWDTEMKRNEIIREIDAKEIKAIKNDSSGKIKYVVRESEGFAWKRKEIDVYATAGYALFLEVVKA